MGFLTSNQQNNTPAARRRHLSNMRFIIVVAGVYILYEGISQIVKNTAETPVWFYVYLVLFAAAIVFALILNEKRIRVLDQKIAEEEAKEAKEKPAEEEEPNDLDEPRR